MTHYTLSLVGMRREYIQPTRPTHASTASNRRGLTSVPYKTRNSWTRSFLWSTSFPCWKPSCNGKDLLIPPYLEYIVWVKNIFNYEVRSSNSEVFFLCFVHTFNFILFSKSQCRSWPGRLIKNKKQQNTFVFTVLYFIIILFNYK